MLTPSKIELEVQILNHCFDDIERFVTRLQNSTEFFKELERRQKQRKSHKKSIGDGMLGLRAQMPPPQHFVDIFQKFKLSFNLLAKLKAHIHDPNAPELIHFLFTPLTLIFNTTKDHPYRGLSKTVWTPMITKEAKELLLNCLTSREQDLWLLLGESWSITSDEAKHQPHLYGIYDNQIYNPVFYDGWSPSLSLEAASEQNEMSRLAFVTAAQVQAQSHLIQNQPQLPLQKQRFYSNTQPQFNDEPLTGKQQQQVASKFNSSSNNQFNDQRQIIQGLLNGQIGPTDLQNNNNNNINRQINIPNYDKMKKWAIDLCYRGVK
jgi:mRNA-degrading endonuclease YafQ of YafQ-DinJ toxin-antitoxin module